MRSREASPAFLHAPCCHEHHFRSPKSLRRASGQAPGGRWGELPLASHHLSLPPQDHQVAHQDRQGVLHIAWQTVDVVPLPPSSPEQQHPRRGSVPLSADDADVVPSVGSSGTSRKRGTSHIHTALLLEDGGSVPAPVLS